MFKNILLEIQEELNNHKRSRDDMFIDCVKERLNKSIQNYNEDLQKTLGFLSRQNELNVMNKANKKV